MFCSNSVYLSLPLKIPILSFRCCCERNGILNSLFRLRTEIYGGTETQLICVLIICSNSLNVSASWFCFSGSLGLATYRVRDLRIKTILLLPAVSGSLSLASCLPAGDGSCVTRPYGGRNLSKSERAPSTGPTAPAPKATETRVGCRDRGRIPAGRTGRRRARRVARRRTGVGSGRRRRQSRFRQETKGRRDLKVVPGRGGRRPGSAAETQAHRPGMDPAPAVRGLRPPLSAPRNRVHGRDSPGRRAAVTTQAPR